MTDKQVEKASAEDGGKGDEKPLRYPWQVFFIIVTEACERFCYYGMNAILTLYFVNKFKESMTDDKAEDLGSIIMHVFKMLSYLSPLFGAAIADSKFGKVRTIFWLSLVYSLGCIVMALGAVSNDPDQGIENFPNIPISLVGLFLIAFGTGGIKPCVVTLGADQFKVPEQQRQLGSFVIMFYFSINAGSLLSTFITPYLSRVACMGEDKCYSLAFGVPGALMIVAVIIFVLGRPMYKENYPDKNIFIESWKCVTHAISNRKNKPAGGNWLEAANDKFDMVFINDLKAVFRVGKIFLMYPLFWTLYDQQGSRWTIQASKMNGDISGFQILPETVQAINAFMILFLIPVFDRIIYPLTDKCGLLKKPLQRIIVGMFGVALAFVVSGILELELRKTYADLPEDSQVRMTIHNGMNADIHWSTQGLPLGEILSKKTTYSENIDLPNGAGSYSIEGWFMDGVTNRTFQKEVDLSEEEAISFLFASTTQQTGVFFPANYEDQLEKSGDTMPYARLIMDSGSTCKNATVSLHAKKYDESWTAGGQWFDWEAIQLEAIGEYDIKVTCQGSDDDIFAETTTDFDVGGCYNVYIYENELGDGEIEVATLTTPSSISIFWIFPQYLILTVGEVLFSITSLEFAYTQAPQSMKAIIQSMFLLTTFAGNLITTIVIETTSNSNVEQYVEFFIFAGLLVANTLVLMFFAVKYRYVTYGDDGMPIEETEIEDEKKKEKE